MSITANAPPELHYSEETADIFNVLYSVTEQIWERGKERTAQYLVDAGIYADTIGEKYQSGKYYRIFETQGGKRGTVSYDMRTQEIALNDEPIKSQRCMGASA
jgi:hypothetical protein